VTDERCAISADLRFPKATPEPGIASQEYVKCRSESDEHGQNQHGSDPGEERDKLHRRDSARVLMARSPAAHASVVQHVRRP
jgi:hypothetical protein